MLKVNFSDVRSYLPIIFLGLTILVEALLLAFYFPGQIFNILDKRDQLGRLATDVKSLATANNQLVAVDSNQLTLELAIAEVALPDEKRVAGVITGLSTVASASGVTTKAISFSPGNVGTVSAVPAANEIEIGDKVKAIPVTMTISASLSQFLDYLKKLSVASQLLGVTAINFSLSANPPGGDVGLLVYYLPARLGKPGWQYIPTISADDLKVLSTLSPSDIFNLPGVPR